MSRPGCSRRTGRATSARPVNSARQKWRNKVIAPYGRCARILVGRNCFIAPLRTNPDPGAILKGCRRNRMIAPYKKREARDDKAIKTNAVCRRSHHGAAHQRRLWATAGGEAWHAELPDLLRSQGAGGVRARRRDDSFLLVPGRAQSVRERAPAGSRLR